MSTYYAVIFTSLKKSDTPDYAVMAERMVELAKLQPGYIGVESARQEMGITVSYWESLEAIKNWKLNTEHLIAQEKGKQEWYSYYKVRICKVEREYEM